MKKLIREETGPSVTVDGKTYTTAGSGIVVQLWEDEDGNRSVTTRMKTPQESIVSYKKKENDG